MRHNFRKLRIWEVGLDLVDLIYDFANTLPDDEKYGLRSQLTRGAVSIPSNIAEGSGKSSNLDFRRFVETAIGSAYELETQLIICQRRNLGETGLIEKALHTVREQQHSLMSFHNYLTKS